MKITPAPGKIQIQIEKPKVGILDTSSRDSVTEAGKVIAVGAGVEWPKKGDKVFVKTWALDNITLEDERYYFISVSSEGILAVVE